MQGDVIETNTFSGTTIGLHDSCFKGEPTRGRRIRILSARGGTMLVFALLFMKLILKRPGSRARPPIASRMNRQATICRRINGPLPVAGSISPDVNDPAFRAVSFDQLRQNYFDEAKALLEAVSIFSLSKPFSIRSTERLRYLLLLMR